MSRRSATLLSAVLLTLGAFGSPLFAQSADELARVEKEMSARKAAAAKLEETAQKQAGEIHELRSKLIEATAFLQDKQEEKNRLEAKLSALEKDATARAKALDEAQTRLSRMTGGLIRLAREPPALFALRETTAADHVRRAVLLRALLPRVKEETDALVDQIGYFSDLQRQAAEQKRLTSAASQNLVWQKHNLDQLVRTRQGLLKKTEDERAAMDRQLAALAKEAKDLKQLMEKVSSSDWGKTVRKGAREPAPSLRSGLLNPVSGKIVRAYGEKDEFGVSSDGVTYASNAGAPVVAPQSGRVVFLGPFQGYGKIVILQHAGGHHSFMSGFGRIDAELGQSVAAGEPLGVLPDADEEARLYFEWRKNKETADPFR